MPPHPVGSGVDQLLAGDEALELSAGDDRDLLTREAGLERGAKREDHPLHRCPERDVGRIEHLAGWHEREQRAQIGRAVPRRVEERTLG